MASNDNKILLQCSQCKNGLDMESKSFPCLHSFCETCLNKEVKGETNGNGHCPKCDEIFQLDQLTPSPILVSDLKCQPMESTKRKCDFCLDDENKSSATNWCKDCDTFFCDSCYHFHQKLSKKQHNSTEISGKGEEVEKSTMADMCKSHNKIENSYCKRCNVCLCDTCYISHLKDSGHCSSHPLSVKEEALKKRNSQGLTLLREIHDLEKDLEEKCIKSRIYHEELEKQCDLECKKLWQNHDNLIEGLKVKTQKMCTELQQISNEQIIKLQKFLQETERMLKKLEIWRLKLHYLFKKGAKEKDIVLGVELVARNLKSSSPDFHQKIKEPLMEWQLEMKYTDNWKKLLQTFPTKMIGSVSLYSSDNLIKFENQWNLRGWNMNRWIHSIVVSNKNKHIYLADHKNCSIIELKESGELVCELILKDKEGEYLIPTEMFFNSSEILWVNCWQYKGEKLIFLEKKISSLQIQNIMDKKPQNSSFSVCKSKEKILFCDYQKFKIDFYSAEGKYIKTIDTGESGGSWPLIRADPSTGNFWGAIPDTSTIFCFHEDGQTLKSLETEEKICDFYINKSGNIYFCNFKGIFAFFPQKNLHLKLYKFKNVSKCWPKIFATEEKIFVFVESKRKCSIKIFRFVN